MNLAGWIVGITMMGADGSVDFDRDVRPILAANCLSCHGSKKQKGGLALHRKDLAIEGGDDGPAFVPGKAEASRLVRYVSGLEADHQMPPDGAGEPLSAEQVAMLRAWIDQGAAWPDEPKVGAEASSHWAFRKPIRPELPEVKDSNWSKTPIDRFVLAALEKDSLTPSPEADRVTLIRRLSLDLVGLPPSIAEVDAFLADDRKEAYERAIDRLLASPQYGERWARRWLDGARYADTNGYEKDRERSIWPYRDWVIQALNADMPFDRFTVEQLAGDLLADATVDQKVATGFHRNTMINEEGGIDVEEFRFASMVDRVATTGAVWLGLTLQCAQCHTHKYDPITRREYYRFMALLDNTDEPDLDIPNPAIAARQTSIQAKIDSLETSLTDQFPDRDPAMDWLVMTPTKAMASSGATLASQPDGSILATGTKAEGDVYELAFDADLRGLAAIKLEAMTDPSLPKSGPGRAPNGNFVVLEFEAKVGDRPIAITSAEADVSQIGFAIEGAIDGNTQTGWAIDDGSGRLNQTRSATFHVKAPADASGRLTIRIDQSYGGKHTLGRFRISLGKRPAGLEVPAAETRRSRLLTKLAEWESGLKLTRWAMAVPSKVESAKGATMTVLDDRSVLASGDKPNNDSYRVMIPPSENLVSAIRLEVLPHKSLPGGGPGRAPLFSVGNFLLSEARVEAVKPDGSTVSVAVAAASADFEEAGRSASHAVDGRTDTGWAVGGGVGKPHAIVFKLATPVETGSPIVLTLDQTYIHQTTLGRFRISTTSDANASASGLTAEVEEVALIPTADRSIDQSRRIERAFLGSTPFVARQVAEIEALKRSMPRFSTSMVMQDRPIDHPRTTRIRIRGEFLKPAQAVTPGVPAVLPPLPEGARADRLAMARWVASEDNPMVARVVVNRAWQAFFGRGLVATLDDFGTRGERPSHPELLDWLATEFPRQGWSQKAMHRLIVTSATYRQSSRATPALLALDPRNEKLARGPRFRVDAEIIRDIALSAAGLLDLTIGGPSVFPPQPDGVTSLAYGQMAWPTSIGRDRYRRGLYTYVKRTAPFAAFSTFDSPSSELACVRRERSNTPLQALTVLNDPAFVEAARAMGRRVVIEGPADVEGRARFAFRLCLSREPEAAERAMLVDFEAAQLARLKAGEVDPRQINGDSDDKDRAAWSLVSRALLNLDETITKE